MKAFAGGKKLIIGVAVAAGASAVAIGLACFVFDCGRRHSGEPPSLEPHEVFTSGRWNKLLHEIGFTGLGPGMIRIHLDGREASDIVSLVGEPTRRLRDESERLPVRYPHIVWPVEYPPFDERWVYSGPLSDLTVYFSEAKVVLAIYQYCDV